MTPILILAAGASGRMRGADKLMQPVDGVPLLLRQVRVALSTGAPVLVTLPSRLTSRRTLLAGLNARMIDVGDVAEGLSASIRAGVAAVPADAGAVLIWLADLPEIDQADLLTLLNRHQDSPQAPVLRATSASGNPGHPVLFPARFFPDLLRLQGDDGARALLQIRAAEVQLIALPDNHATTDLDTPEAWAIWRRRTGR